MPQLTPLSPLVLLLKTATSLPLPDIVTHFPLVDATPWEDLNLNPLATLLEDLNLATPWEDLNLATPWGRLSGEEVSPWLTCISCNVTSRMTCKFINFEFFLLNLNSSVYNKIL
jgi:hypothetical protein